MSPACEWGPVWPNCQKSVYSVATSSASHSETLSGPLSVTFLNMMYLIGIISFPCIAVLQNVNRISSVHNVGDVTVIGHVTVAAQKMKRGACQVPSDSR